jgi:hypothetical protein
MATEGLLDTGWSQLPLSGPDSPLGLKKSEKLE